ncbi:sugar ABC transporter permease [soil metagenome]
MSASEDVARTGITWAEDEFRPDGRYLLDRTSVLGPLMLLPAVVYIIGLVGIPFFIAIAYAFSDVTVGDQSIDWVGLDNFRSIIDNQTFRKALSNSFKFAIASQLIVIVLANVLATVLSSQFHGKRIVRFLVLLPWTTPLALAVIGWLWTLDSVYSPIDAFLRGIGLLGPDTHFGPGRNMLWLAKPDLAQLSVLMIHVWRTLPLATVILMAGLSAIPQDVKDAADIDGASFWRQLVYIRIPLLIPIMAVAILYGIVFTFTDMTVVYILTRGGPIDNTQVLASWAFFTGVEASNLAHGAAIALFLFPLLVVVAMLMLRLARRSETT